MHSHLDTLFQGNGWCTPCAVCMYVVASNVSVWRWILTLTACTLVLLHGVHFPRAFVHVFNSMMAAGDAHLTIFATLLYVVCADVASITDAATCISIRECTFDGAVELCVVFIRRKIFSTLWTRSSGNIRHCYEDSSLSWRNECSCIRHELCLNF